MLRRAIATTALAALAAPCTGGATEPKNGLPLLAQRIEAARETAATSPACMQAQPFYWEIGHARGKLAGGQAGREAPHPHTALAIASASKWLYAAYVLEQRPGGQLDDTDIRFLHFRSGHTRLRTCLRHQTVEACQASLLNGRGRIDDATAGRFDYNGGHMQRHAVTMGLGELDADGLGAAIGQALAKAMDPGWRLRYNQAQPAGGAVMSAADHAQFLRALLRGDLRLGALLGRHAVCTNAASCPGQAIGSPIPAAESWHYSLGHWVEDDPRVGDGAFSSPGAFGFYPWIDAGKTYYGILAREERRGVRADEADDQPAMRSVACGRRIRAAWMTGAAQR